MALSSFLEANKARVGTLCMGAYTVPCLSYYLQVQLYVMYGVPYSSSGDLNGVIFSKCKPSKLDFSP